MHNKWVCPPDSSSLVNGLHGSALTMWRPSPLGQGLPYSSRTHRAPPSVALLQVRTGFGMGFSAPPPSCPWKGQHRPGEKPPLPQGWGTQGRLRLPPAGAEHRGPSWLCACLGWWPPCQRFRGGVPRGQLSLLPHDTDALCLGPKPPFSRGRVTSAPMLCSTPRRCWGCWGGASLLPLTPFNRTRPTPTADFTDWGPLAPGVQGSPALGHYPDALSLKI